MTVFAILAAVIVAGVVFALQALDVRADLLAAKDRIASVGDLTAAKDTAGIQDAADDVRELTTHADDIVQGPLWGLAANVPIVGVNVAAVRSATEATHILVRDAMPPALRLLSTVQLDQVKLSGGGVDLAPFREAVNLLPAVNAAFSDAQSRVAGIDTAALAPFVQDAIGQLLTIIDQAAPALQKVEKYLPTALQIAGADGPRTYIVLFQNNAEIRATGGNAATSAIIDVDNGRITMREDQGVSAFLLAGTSGDGVLGFADGQTQSIYEPDTTTYSQNYTRTPDFPTSAQMYRALWQQTVGGEIDGVISLDPVVLSYMLRATGPIALDDGSRLTADNAVKLLLSDTYERFRTDAPAADAFFAKAAARVFSAVSSGNWEPLAMLDQVRIGMSEGRIHTWFTHEPEQAMSVEFHLDGALTTDNTAQTQVGLFLNDSAYSKLEYYLSTAVALTCDATARTMTTTLTATSAVPGPGLSSYVLGWRNEVRDIPRTSMMLDVLYFAPPGSTILAADSASGDLPEWDRAGVEKGHAVKSVTVAVAMGGSRTASFTSSLPAGPLGPLSVRTSPTVGQTPVTVDPSCDGLFG